MKLYVYFISNVPRLVILSPTSTNEELGFHCLSALLSSSAPSTPIPLSRIWCVFSSSSSPKYHCQSTRFTVTFSLTSRKGPSLLCFGNLLLLGSQDRSCAARRSTSRRRAPTAGLHLLHHARRARTSAIVIHSRMAGLAI